MKITKTVEVEGKTEIVPEVMEKINRFSKKELGPEEVFIFDVRLCDNEVDRDFERFSKESLFALGELFPGKTGIFDHSWSAEGQKARIFSAEVVEERGIHTAAGDDYCWLKGSAYMLRTEGNRELISEIEGGIKREVSIGCRAGQCICSICGEPMGTERCVHQKGREYDGKLCWGELMDIKDAYEWSFVAVPAQKNAGILKRFGTKESGSELRKEYEEKMKKLEHLADVGRKYLGELKREVLKLALLTEETIDGEVLGGIVEKMTTEELKTMKKSYEDRMRKLYPPTVQMRYEEKKQSQKDCGEFII